MKPPQRDRCPREVSFNPGSIAQAWPRAWGNHRLPSNGDKTVGELVGFQLPQEIGASSILTGVERSDFSG
ncbi:MAG: hypothetical protein IGR92_04635 [Leptolyngbyaceae cyanobacterium T60_A2020_046]|nr:hypothetical protein [Leptolyngbyaceae cyanobacterium T60_A2020_046]